MSESKARQSIKQQQIILASSSAIRARILRSAGVDFDIVKPEVDETAIKRAAKSEALGLSETAMRLAEAKCLAVAREQRGIVIGADQILEFEGCAFDKPTDMEEARDRLLTLQGASHSLINAVALAVNGDIIWRSLEQPKLAMRMLSAQEIDAYLEAAGPDILNSVGAYQVEGEGVRLFDSICGDYFAVLGLALLPLLKVLRREAGLVF